MTSIASILIRAGVTALFLFALHFRIGGTLRLGPLLDPLAGVYATARSARNHPSGELFLDGMQQPVILQYDDRGVPHIYANSDQDVTMALGYVVARDRLFQMDFIHRVATGTLSEIMGESAVETDQFFRRNGIARAVKKNTMLLPKSSPREWEVTQWYIHGVNAYLKDLKESEYPLEYRILDTRPPETFDASFTMALLAFMTYDLSFQSQDIGLESIRTEIGPEQFNLLYPLFSSWEKTIIQPEEAHWIEATPGPDRGKSTSFPRTERLPTQAPELAEGFIEGKGSNNWAVDGSRSSTGMPILAGDMHLGLSLPAIWYEAHLVTPSTNVYGVTFPSVPAIVEGITPTTAWTFTNTGSDQIDYYRLKVSEEGTSYWYDNEWRSFEVEMDTIFVRNAPEVIEKRLISHIGPVLQGENGDYALKWVGHELGSTFAAVWDMNRATDYAEFETAIRRWDYPMQNILYAGSDGIIAVRSTGYLPIRANGNAFGVLDGTTSETAWIGRVPFDELPHSISPDRGFLTSTNQRPVPEGYPYYMGQDWRSVYRSMRIFELLSSKDTHSVRDLMSYQADVQAMQARLFIPLIRGLDGLSHAGIRLRDALLGFDGYMSLEATEPRLFVWFMNALKDIVWDEAVFKSGRDPKEIRILDLIAKGEERWFDIESTDEVESSSDVLRIAVNTAGEKWQMDGFHDRAWGDEQYLEVRHITRSPALRALWSKTYPFPGYKETLSPAVSNPVHWSASWRVVVDFSTSPPTAAGIYPGGQSGNPFSKNYERHLKKYVDFEYYELDLSGQPTFDQD